jgi:hypothetical protein
VDDLLRLGASEESAVVALRKANGDVQRAAGDILDQVMIGFARSRGGGVCAKIEFV